MHSLPGLTILEDASKATGDSQSNVLNEIKLNKNLNTKALSDQLVDLDNAYPGGLKAYIEKSRSLLKKAVEGGNPFEGYTAQVPEGVDLSYGDDLDKYEEEVRSGGPERGRRSASTAERVTIEALSSLTADTDARDQLLQGMRVAKDTVFVLVAGGLGER